MFIQSKIILKVCQAGQVLEMKKLKSMKKNHIPVKSLLQLTGLFYERNGGRFVPKARLPGADRYISFCGPMLVPTAVLCQPNFRVK